MKISFLINFFSEKKDFANHCREIKNFIARYIDWFILKNRLKDIYKEVFDSLI